MTHSSEGRALGQQESEPTGIQTLTTEALFAGQEEIILLHNGAPYRLRITRQNKLILTK